MNFSDRINAAQKAGDLTVADLQHWFGRPYATVRSWLNGVEPHGPRGREAGRLLKLLETSIKSQNGFPISLQLSNLERPKHIEKLRNALDASNQLSQGGTARTGI